MSQGNYVATDIHLRWQKRKVAPKLSWLNPFFFLRPEFGENLLIALGRET
jgi:hypothetical protein